MFRLAIGLRRWRESHVHVVSLCSFALRLTMQTTVVPERRGL